MTFLGRRSIKKRSEQNLIRMEEEKDIYDELDAAEEGFMLGYDADFEE